LPASAEVPAPVINRQTGYEPATCIVFKGKLEKLSEKGKLKALNKHFLSDQTMCLYFLKKYAKDGRFSVLRDTFQGQKHGCKDFGLQATTR
jgi:hypothetical protein